MRIVLPPLIVACCFVLAASAASASRAAAPLVSCGSIIGQTSGPRDAGYRPALGVLSVPPASMLRTAASAEEVEAMRLRLKGIADEFEGDFLGNGSFIQTR